MKEAFPWKVKGRRELLNIECSINYDSMGASSKHGKARLMLSSVECFVWVSGFDFLWV